jgi:hypothetical protein
MAAHIPNKISLLAGDNEHIVRNKSTKLSSTAKFNGRNFLDPAVSGGFLKGFPFTNLVPYGVLGN